ncbi:MAG: cupin domain-containing protein [Actinomycetota bacterium]|mgnify:FL=1
MRFIPDIAAEVPITPDGTLSRVLHRDDRLRLVGFAFDAGQELTEHTAAVPVVIQALTGTLDVTAGGETVRLTPGGWVALAASESHTVVALQPSVLLLTMLHSQHNPLDPHAT